MSSQLLGWSACVFILLSCSYSLFKRFKSIRSKINLPIKKLLDYHCTFCIIATILASIHVGLAFIHAGGNLSNIRFFTGYFSLLLLVLVTLIGILMKYFRKDTRHKKFWLNAHILLSIMLIGAILLHIFSYLLLQ